MTAPTGQSSGGATAAAVEGGRPSTASSAAGGEASTAPAIAVADLVVRAGRRDILRIDRLTAAAGEMVTILGPNGAGKTTLLRCLLGLHAPAAGQVCVLGLQVAGLGPVGLARLRRQIGYVPQLLSARSEMPLTVREVVAIGRTGLAGLGRRLGRADWAVVDDWLDRLGLGDLAGRGYGQISGGQQRKTLVARAMVAQPRLLLLDEPTANLDLGWRERIVEVIGSLYALGGLTVVLVCHELEVLPAACGRVVVLRDGQLAADAAPETVLSGAFIADLYGADLAVMRRGGRWAVVPGEGDHA